MNERSAQCTETTAPVRAGRILGRPSGGSRRNNLTHAEFLELILQDELAVRNNRLIQRRTKAAAFRELKTVGSVRLRVQSLDQPPADLRTGDLPVHSRTKRRALARDRRAWASRSWCRPLATRPSSRAFWSTTARCSTWSATSCRTKSLGGQEKVLAKYLRPDLVIIDDMGMK